MLRDSGVSVIQRCIATGVAAVPGALSPVAGEKLEQQPAVYRRVHATRLV